jgi:hypothetical protein
MGIQQLGFNLLLWLGEAVEFGEGASVEYMSLDDS